MAPSTRVLGGEALAWPTPVDTLVMLTLLSEEVLFVFLEPTEEVVMVVFPAVEGNLTLDVAVGLEDIPNLQWAI